MSEILWTLHSKIDSYDVFRTGDLFDNVLIWWSVARRQPEQSVRYEKLIGPYFQKECGETVPTDYWVRRLFTTDEKLRFTNYLAKSKDWQIHAEERRANITKPDRWSPAYTLTNQPIVIGSKGGLGFVVSGMIDLGIATAHDAQDVTFEITIPSGSVARSVPRLRAMGYEGIEEFVDHILPVLIADRLEQLEEDIEVRRR